MGVLNITDHLKHRRRITEENADYTWEDNEVINDVPEPAQPVRPSPQRKHKLRPQYYLQTPSHKPKGNRSGRRYENTCFLLSLVDHEEIHELQLSDIVHKTMTIFSSLFEDPQKMKIWNDFANLPEEDQFGFFARRQTCSEDNMSSGCLTADNRQETPCDLFAKAEKSYLNIDKKIRGTFQKKRFPLGGLELLETNLTSFLSDSPDAVILSNHPSSLDRMMVHALCQYLTLVCRSHNCTGIRLMEVESNQNSFEPPSILLSQYLKHKILS
ncbi:hypothetical protein QZH41_009448 [Actinostola sp. cb2023]|nr:hypothetical protein QZH41_009448 [Actinostola sp. cb2023]